jgi:hypothetical protein
MAFLAYPAQEHQEHQGPSHLHLLPLTRLHSSMALAPVEWSEPESLTDTPCHSATAASYTPNNNSSSNSNSNNNNNSNTTVKPSDRDISTAAALVDVVSLMTLILFLAMGTRVAQIFTR